MKRRLVLALAMAWALGALATDAQAFWFFDGNDYCSSAGYQDDPQIAPDGSGGFYLAWRDQRNGCCGQIFVLRVQSDGNLAPGWPSNGIRATLTANSQFDPRIIADGFGGAYVAWDQILGAGNTDVYVQRIAGNGVVQPGWGANGVALCTATGFQDQPALVSDLAGGVFVAWRDRRGANADVYATGIAPSGAFIAGWAVNGTAVCTMPGDQNEITLVSDGANAGFVLWVDGRGATTDLYGQRFDSNGGLHWAAQGAALCNAASNQTHPRAVRDGSGGFTMVWTDERNGNADIYAQRVQFVSTPFPGWPVNGIAVCNDAAAQTNPEIAADGAGGFVTAWQDSRNFGFDADVYAAKVLNNATIAGGWPGNGLRVCDNAFGQTDVSVASDGSGGLFVTWLDVRAGNADVYAQHLTAAAASAYPLAGLRVCGASNSQYLARAVPDGSGGAFVSWQDERFGFPDNDIFATHLSPASNLLVGNTPSGWSSPVVPRSSQAPDFSNVTVTPTLNGNSNDNWYYMAVDQQGPHNMPRWDAFVYLDDESVQMFGIVDDGNVPGQYGFSLPPPTYPVRGGRHSLTLVADPNNWTYESNEADNVWRGQWIWSPTDVAGGNGQERTLPPLTGGFPNPNADGMRYPHGPNAWVTGVMPLGRDDYDLYLYDDYSGSQTGYSNLRKASALGGRQTDFVVGHFVGTPSTVYPAAVRFHTTDAANYAADQTESIGRLGNDVAQWTDQVLAPNRFVDVYEAFFTAGSTHFFLLERLAGDSDIAFQVCPATAGGIWSRYDAGTTASNPVTAVTDTLAFTASESGWHPIVVYRTEGFGTGGTPVTYNFRWGFNYIVGVDDDAGRPTELSFAGAVPNPVRDGAEMAFALPQAAHVKLALYDLTGRRVRMLADRDYDAGRHTLSWGAADGSGPRLSAGVYWARMEAGGRAITRRVVVMD